MSARFRRNKQNSKNPEPIGSGFSYRKKSIFLSKILQGASGKVQNSREPLDMYGEMERITRDYEAFRREPLVEEFLESELRVCRMIQNITLQVTRAVDLDTEEVTAGIEL